jgi:hypothetical protein
MKKYLFLMGVILFFGCNNDKKEAQVALDKARVQYENGEYATAKQSLDELKTLYPKQYDVQNEGLQLMRRIELKEQERNLTYCDSLLIVRRAEVDSMQVYFVFEKDPEYDAVGKYIEKKLAASPTSQKLRTGVEEDGGIYLISTYSASSPLRHNRLKVSVSSGEYMETEAIPFDGGANYSFKDDNTGITHELVTYRKGRDNGVIRFIYSHSGEKQTASYLGGKNFSFPISAAEIASLSKSVDLSAALSDMQYLQNEKEKAEKRIEYLKSKLN